MSAAAEACKEQRDRTPPPPRSRGFRGWRARFSQCVAFKNFAQNVGNVLEDGFFKLVKTADFEGLEVEGIDAMHICLVRGRLEGAVELPEAVEHFKFCVPMAKLLTCLPSAHPQHFLELSGDEDGSELRLRIFEPEVRSYCSSFVLRTHAKEMPRVDLEDLSYAFYVEMDLAVFKTAVKTARDQRAESTSFTVYEPKRTAGDGGDAQSTVFFVVRSPAEGVESSFLFQSTTESDEAAEGQPRAIRAYEAPAGDSAAMPAAEDLTTVYGNDFSTDYLFKFVKSMERHAVTLRLAQTLPLVVEYPLGCETKNFLRFVLAAKKEL